MIDRNDNGLLTEKQIEAKIKIIREQGRVMMANAIIEADRKSREIEVEAERRLREIDVEAVVKSIKAEADAEVGLIKLKADVEVRRIKSKAEAERKEILAEARGLNKLPIQQKLEFMLKYEALEALTKMACSPSCKLIILPDPFEFVRSIVGHGGTGQLIPAIVVCTQ